MKNMKSLSFLAVLSLCRATAYAEPRTFVSEQAVLTAMRDDLKKSPDTRQYKRYFSLAALHNDPTITDEQLQQEREGLAKLANSLSWNRELSRPFVMGPQKTLLRFDIRELGWDRQALWRSVEKAYPYKTDLETHSDPAVSALAREIRVFNGGAVPYFRSDWFLNTASRPPLYHEFLELPGTVAELERILGVDADANVKNGTAARAGLKNSNVALFNRLVERHPTRYGAYWKSYDFAGDEEKQDLTRRPTGPQDPFVPEPPFAHAGGEFIFNLPNGLQAYLLADKTGRRIDVAPVEIVADPQETSGTQAVVNGLSCMHCHARGIIPARDTLAKGILASDRLSAQAKERVRLLHIDRKAMDELVNTDRKRFETSMEDLIAYLRSGKPDAAAGPVTLPETIGPAALRYQRPLPLERAAAELGLPAVDLRKQIENDAALRGLGLGPLNRAEPVGRGIWETTSLEASRLTGQGGARLSNRRSPIEIFARVVQPPEGNIVLRLVGPSGKVLDQTLEAGAPGPVFVRMSVAPQGGLSWNPGTYRAEFYAEGRLQSRFTFEVKP